MKLIYPNPLFSLSLASMLLAGSAISAESGNTSSSDKPAETDETKVDESITVNADRLYPSTEESRSYRLEQSDSATRLKLKVKETPQTLNSVTQQQIKDFGLSNARKALAVTPGVIVQNLETERTSYGTRGSEISNFQTDGLGMPMSSYNYQSGDIDTVVYDRVEVLKGANGLSSSLGDTGATVNFIRKRPTKELKTGLGLSQGSWNTSRVEGDVSSSLSSDGKVRGRIVGAYQKGDSYLDKYKLEKGIASAVIEADLTDSTRLTLGHLLQQSRPEGNNWGSLPLLNQRGEQLSYERSYNPNPEWSQWNRDTKNSFVELKQKLSTDWELKTVYQYETVKEDSALSYYFGAPDDQGNGVSLYASRYTTHDKTKFLDASLSGKYSLFGQDHEVVVGTNWMKLESRQRSFAADSTPAVNWNGYTGDYAKPSFTYGNLDSQGADYNQEISSIYAATRLHMGDAWKLLLGANQAKALSSGYSYGAPMNYEKSKLLPYAGLSYDFLPNYTAYSSFTTIYRPQTTQGKDGQLLQPVEGRGYEAGLKANLFQGQALATLALFQTDQNHYPLRASDSAQLIKQYEVGRLKTQGYELGLSGKVADGTDLVLGFTHTRMRDAKINKETRTYLPSRVADVLVTHRLKSLSALKVGAGLRFQSKTWQDVEGTVYTADGAVPYAGRIRQGEYGLVQLMASYDLSKALLLQANVQNLSDKKYLNNFAYGQGFYGAPRNYTLSVNYQN